MTSATDTFDYSAGVITTVASSTWKTNYQADGWYASGTSFSPNYALRFDHWGYNGHFSIYHDTATSSVDQYAKCKYPAAEVGTTMAGPAVRCASSRCYALVCSTTQAKLVAMSSGSKVAETTAENVTITSSTEIKIWVTGTGASVRVFGSIGGVQLANSNWYPGASAQYDTGKAGVGAWVGTNTDDFYIDDWEGGDGTGVGASAVAAIAGRHYSRMRA